jgi:hypothetical protein
VALEAVRKHWIENELKAKAPPVQPAGSQQKAQRPNRNTKEVMAGGGMGVKQTGESLRSASTTSTGRADMRAILEEGVQGGHE